MMDEKRTEKRTEERSTEGAKGSEVINRKGVTTEADFLKQYGTEKTDDKTDK